MKKVVGIRFRPCGKINYFDPGELAMKLDDGVIIETEKGLEYGTVALPPSRLPDELVPDELEPILRIADEEDTDIHFEMLAKERESRSIFVEKVRDHELDMKLVDVECSFEGNRIIFYFSAEGRVDFRDLVKDLASELHMRIELRQIGVRDETRMLGGIGTCGRPLCCNAYLKEFVPVTIKMAKSQNLSLNPTKISGSCGRLMCCLRNESDTYDELSKDLPKRGTVVPTTDCFVGVTLDANILAQTVRVIVDLENDEKEVREYHISHLKFTPGVKRPVRKTDQRPVAKTVVATAVKAEAKKKAIEAEEEQRALEAAAAEASEAEENGESRRSRRRAERAERRERRRKENADVAEASSEAIAAEGGAGEEEAGEHRRRRRRRSRGGKGENAEAVQQQNPEHSAESHSERGEKHSDDAKHDKSKRSKKNDRKDRHAKGERSERAEHGERSERRERRERNERPERAERQARPEITEAERAERAERRERQRRERAERAERREQGQRVERTERAERPDREERAERARRRHGGYDSFPGGRRPESAPVSDERPARAERPERAERIERTERSEGSGSSGNRHRRRRRSHNSGSNGNSEG